MQSPHPHIHHWFCLMLLLSGCRDCDPDPGGPCPGFRDVAPTAADYSLNCAGCTSFTNDCTVILDLNRTLKAPRINIQCSVTTFLRFDLPNPFVLAVGSYEETLPWVFAYKDGDNVCSSWSLVPALRDLPPVEHPLTLEIVDRAGTFDINPTQISDDFRMTLRVKGQRSEPLRGWNFDAKIGKHVSCHASFVGVELDLTFVLTKDSFEWVEDLSGSNACGTT